MLDATYGEAGTYIDRVLFRIVDGKNVRKVEGRCLLRSAKALGETDTSSQLPRLVLKSGVVASHGGASAKSPARVVAS